MYLMQKNTFAGPLGYPKTIRFIVLSGSYLVYDYARSLTICNSRPFLDTQGTPQDFIQIYLQSLVGRQGFTPSYELAVFNFAFALNDLIVAWRCACFSCLNATALPMLSNFLRCFCLSDNALVYVQLQ